MEDKRMMENSQQKRNIWFGKDRDKYTNPWWTAKMGFIFAVVIIIINTVVVLLFKRNVSSASLYGLAPVVAGILGTCFGIKKKSGWKIISLNILVIIFGLFVIVSGVLLEMFLFPK